MRWRVESCSFEAVEPFVFRASLDNVTINNPDGVAYFSVREPQYNTIVGIAAVLPRKNVALLKANWTKPLWRSEGIGKTLFRAQLNFCKKKRIPFAEAWCTKDSLQMFKRAGFKSIKKTRTLTLVRIQF